MGVETHSTNAVIEGLPDFERGGYNGDKGSTITNLYMVRYGRVTASCDNKHEEFLPQPMIEKVQRLLCSPAAWPIGLGFVIIVAAILCWTCRTSIKAVIKTDTVTGPLPQEQPLMLHAPLDAQRSSPPQVVLPVTSAAQPAPEEWEAELMKTLAGHTFKPSTPWDILFGPHRLHDELSEFLTNPETKERTEAFFASILRGSLEGNSALCNELKSLFKVIPVAIDGRVAVVADQSESYMNATLVAIAYLLLETRAEEHYASAARAILRQWEVHRTDESSSGRHYLSKSLHLLRDDELRTMTPESFNLLWRRDSNEEFYDETYEDLSACKSPYIENILKQHYMNVGNGSHRMKIQLSLERIRFNSMGSDNARAAILEDVLKRSMSGSLGGSENDHLNWAIVEVSHNRFTHLTPALKALHEILNKTDGSPQTREYLSNTILYFERK